MFTFLAQIVTQHYINEYINKLYSVYEEYSALGTVIFLGDFNTEISGTGYLARYGIREKILDNFLKKKNLFSPISDIHCNGPLFSFDPYTSGMNRSLIDHAIVDHSKADLITQCCVIDDNVLIFSDHLPILLNIKCLKASKVTVVLTTKLNWKKLERKKNVIY